MTAMATKRLVVANSMPHRQAPSAAKRISPPATLAVEGPGSGRRRFPEPFEPSPSPSSPPSSSSAASASTGNFPLLSTADAYELTLRVAGPPIAADALAAAVSSTPPLSATVVAEVAGGPLSGRRVRPAPFEEEGDAAAVTRPRVPSAAGRGDESSEALLREVRARRHGGGC